MPSFRAALKSFQRWRGRRRGCGLRKMRGHGIARWRYIKRTSNIAFGTRYCPCFVGTLGSVHASVSLAGFSIIISPCLRNQCIGSHSFLFVCVPIGESALVHLKSNWKEIFYGTPAHFFDVLCKEAARFVPLNDTLHKLLACELFLFLWERKKLPKEVQPPVSNPITIGLPDELWVKIMEMGPGENCALPVYGVGFVSCHSGIHAFSNCFTQITCP